MSASVIATKLPGGLMCLLILAPFALLLGVSALVKWRRRRRFERVAAVLGFALEDGALRGESHGYAVTVAWSSRKVGTSTRHVSTNPFARDATKSLYQKRVTRTVRAVFTTVTVALPEDAMPPGLVIRSAGGWLSSSPPPGFRWPVGDEAVEAAFVFDAGTETRELARETVRQPVVLDALRVLADVPFELDADRERLQLETKGRFDDPERLKRSVDALVALAARLRVAHRAAIAEGVDEVCATAWAETAGALGLTREGHAMHGRVEGVSVEVTTEYESWTRYTFIEARFDTPLGSSFALAPAGRLDRAKAAVGLGDLRTGDDAFDDRFEIRAAVPDVARERLSDAARAGLLALAEAGDVVVSERVLRLGLAELVRDPERLTRLIRAVAAAAERLDARPDAVGPFR